MQKTILVVDDEPDVLAYLKTLFEDHGFRVETARDGVQALRRAREVKPNLVTLDLNMPQQTGVRTLREIQDDPEVSSTPIVLITAVSEEIDRFLSTRRQVRHPEGFVPKPIDEARLMGVVRRILEE